MKHLLMLVVLKVKEIAEKLGLIADYVVEEGLYNDYWYCRKWNSGVVECWLRQTWQPTGNYIGQLLGGHCYHVSMGIPSIFTHIEVAKGDGRTGTGIGNLSAIPVTLTQIDVYIVGNQQSANMIVRSFYIIGRWK